MADCFDCGLSIHADHAPRIASGQTFHPTPSHCVSALLANCGALRAALGQERRRLAWIADNTGRDAWLDQFDRRFRRGEGADGADDLRAAIDSLLSGREEHTSATIRKVLDDNREILGALGDE